MSDEDKTVNSNTLVVVWFILDLDDSFSGTEYDDGGDGENVRVNNRSRSNINVAETVIVDSDRDNCSQQGDNLQAGIAVDSNDSSEDVALLQVGDAS